MVKAMYSGVAGLKAHQSKMDVIGNNIANVNTWGYKSMDTSFKESIYSTINSGSAGSTANGGYGGTNPSVVGYGSMVSAISANFTSGNQVPTGKNLDLYIDGTAFFAVGPMYGEGEAKSPNDIFLSRVGDFGVVNGYLVDSNGRYVYGSTMGIGGEVYTPGPTTTETIANNQPIPVPGYKKGANGSYTIYGATTPPAADKMNEYKYTASANSPVALSQNIKDDLFPTGTTIPSPLTQKDLKKAIDKYNEANAGDPTKKLYALDEAAADSNPQTIVELSAFDPSVATNTKKDQPRPIPDATVDKDDTTGIVTTTTYKAGSVPGEMTITVTTVTPAPADAESKGPQFDDGRMVFDRETGTYTMIDAVSTLKPLKIPTSCTYYDKEGNIQTEDDIVFSSFHIEQDGMIYGTSTATKNVYLLGCVGLVNVTNPSGMEKADGPYYKPGGSAGEAKIIQPGGITGKLTAGYLESANVDIATEFSNMITTQRGFQANSKIITVTDEMLQELVNMKR